MILFVKQELLLVLLSLESDTASSHVTKWGRIYIIMAALENISIIANLITHEDGGGG